VQVSACDASGLGVLVDAWVGKAAKPQGMRKMTRTVRIGLLALLLALAMVGNAAAQTGLTYFISDVDSIHLPTVQVAAGGGSGQQGGIGTQLVHPTVFENGQVSGWKSPHGDGHHYIFVLDQGTFANYVNFQHNNMRQVITSLVAARCGRRDTVMVRDATTRTAIRPSPGCPPQTATDLTTWVASFDSTTRGPQGPPGNRGRHPQHG
jgi:hypothetical protein